MIRNLLASSGLALIAACATTPADLEPLDPAAFQVAFPVEEEIDHPVRIVETAVPLPLPGQMKAVASTTPEPQVSPEEAIKEGREPNASVAQVLPCYRTLDRIEKSL